MYLDIRIKMRAELSQTKCPYERCTSMLHYFRGEVTAITVKFHYDKEWNEHLHDPNIRTDVYKCGNGHIIQHMHRPGCTNLKCSYAHTSNIIF